MSKHVGEVTTDDRLQTVSQTLTASYKTLLVNENINHWCNFMEDISLYVMAIMNGMCTD